MPQAEMAGGPRIEPGDRTARAAGAQNPASSAIRSGSPFTYVVPDPRRVRTSPDSVTVAAVGGSVGAIILGLIALVVGGVTRLPVVGSLMALLGLAMGIWGLFGVRKRMAIAGLVVCCLGLVLSAYRTGVQIYWSIQGNGPF